MRPWAKRAEALKDVEGDLRGGVQTGGQEGDTMSDLRSESLGAAILGFRAAIGICKAHGLDWKDVGQIVANDIERELFEDHLQRATEMVSKWPKWKRILLGREA